MNLHFRATSSLVRHFPSAAPRFPQRERIDAALNSRFSFQLAFRNEGTRPEHARVEVDHPRGWRVRVRRVGCVPLRHANTGVPKDELDGAGKIPGYVPDPLFDEDNVLLPPGETHAFWVTVCPGPGAEPGDYRIRAAAKTRDGTAKHCAVKVRLHDLEIAKRRDFSVTNWFYADSLIDYYKTNLFDSRFWRLMTAYATDMAEHGQDTLYVPVFTPPLDGVKRPTQLLRVGRTAPHRYRFDWRDVKAYVDVARRCGIEKFEWCHLFTQWGARNAIRVYEGQGADEKLLWNPGTGAVSPVYRRFLSQYLPTLRRFLEAEDLLGRSFFHVSDEPGPKHAGNYRKARALLEELAPWMRVMDALSDIRFARDGLTDMPVPSIQAAPQFVEEGLSCWCYYCCGPRERHLNRLMDTPLPKIGMHGFLFYRWPFHGFLHWGYNYWYQSQTRALIDPYTVQDGLAWPNWAYGDPFMVYPGAAGPVDSIRWEVFAEALQDYALLQTLGVDRDDPILRSIRSFEDFPKTETWIRKTRAILFRKARG